MSESTIESVDKVNHTHSLSSNYWAPLATILEEEEEEIEENIEQASLVFEPNKDKSETMVIDSGATSHFATETIALPHIGEPSTKQVYLPNGSVISGSERAELPNVNFPTVAKRVDILPNLKKSLFSVGKVADEGYTTIFHPRNEGVTIHKEGTVTITSTKPADLQGWRAKSGLWEFNPNKNNKHSPPQTENKPPPPEDTICNVHGLPSTPMAIRYLHAAAGYPTKSTWTAAIKNGNFVTWPLLTVENVNKHYPENNETDKGHMKMQRMNVRSTKIVEEKTEQEDTTPLPKKNDVYTHVFNAHDTMYTDQTGAFPVTSNRGNKYVMVMCEVDGNHIDAEPMKSRTADSLVQTYLILWKRLTSTKVITPKLHILDNEAPEALQEAIKNRCKMQLAPPDTHRSNLAERAIQTFKNHFVSILSGIDKSFPINLWDRLLPQAVLTLNLLRQANANPNVSAHQYVHGTFDYNATPLGPMGCAVQLLNNRERRQSWEEHALDGWYLRTSLDHYCSHCIFVKRTNDEQISNTVNFKHQYITMPTVTPADIAIKAIQDLTNALKGEKGGRREDEFTALEQLEKLVVSKLTTVPGKSNFSKPLPQDPYQPPRVREATNDPPAFNTRSNTWKMDRTDLDVAMNIVETQPDMTNEYANIAVLHPETGQPMRYRQLITHPEFKVVWNRLSANKFGRLAQGIGGRIQGTNTIWFIRKEEVPLDRLKDVTYGKFVCELKPNKEEVERT
jgi:hypothetical protein